jgi:hypothetical protein
MLEKRAYPRYTCEREVEVAFLRAHRPCGNQKAVVRDISAGGLRLEFEQPPPPHCDQILVRTGQMVLSYQVRRRYQRDGAYYTGVQVIT